MSRLDYSKALFGKRTSKAPNQSAASPANTGARTRYGVVSSYDANSGIATVLLDGSVEYDESEGVYKPAPISITSDVPLEDNQRITAIISGTDITVIPDGTSIGTVADTAATSVRDAINQNFWADTHGAHVSDANPIGAATRNILINSNGMALYKGDPNDGGTQLTSFGENLIEFGDGTTNNNSEILFAGDGTTSGAKLDYTIGDQSSPRYSPNTMALSCIEGAVSVTARPNVSSANLGQAGFYASIGREGNVATPIAYLGSIGPTPQSGVPGRASVQCMSSSANSVISIVADEVAVSAASVVLGSGSASLGRSAVMIAGVGFDPKRGVSCTLSSSSAQTLSGNVLSNLGGTLILDSFNRSNTSSANIVSRGGTSPYYGVLCSEAGKVLVSGSVYATGLPSGGHLGAQIMYKRSGTNYRATNAVYSAAGGAGVSVATVAIMPYALVVEAGDIIYLQAESSSNNVGSVGAGNAYLTVQYI